MLEMLKGVGFAVVVILLVALWVVPNLSVRSSKYGASSGETGWTESLQDCRYVRGLSKG